MGTTPTVENAVTRFDARTAEGPNCGFGRRIPAVAVEYGPAAVTASRPRSESEADFPL